MLRPQSRHPSAGAVSPRLTLACSLGVCADQGIMMGIKNVFTLCTKYRGVLVQAHRARDLEEWLYVLDPLLAGTLLSRAGQAKK